MPATAYGNFHNFCRDSGNEFATIPVCNLFLESPARGGVAPYFGGCNLTGISLGGQRYLANLGQYGTRNGQEHVLMSEQDLYLSRALRL